MSVRQGATHLPVLKQEFLQYCKEMAVKPHSYLDGTFGRGGHLEIVQEIYGDIDCVALDQDNDAINAGLKKNYRNVEFIHCNFHDILHADSNLNLNLNGRNFDLILFDLGVSSPQLDESHRGFSFYHDGPLDMRMNQCEGLQAKEIINNWEEEDLIKLFRDLGEIYKPFRVVKSILRQRENQPFETTSQLSSLIESVEGWRKKGRHPATQYFLALRLEVNQELDRLGDVIEAWIGKLNPGGRIFVISFHSLEDRIIKFCFRDHKNQGKVLTKKVIQATRAEALTNPRSRSAKLRVFEKGDMNV